MPREILESTTATVAATLGTPTAAVDGEQARTRETGNRAAALTPSDNMIASVKVDVDDVDGLSAVALTPAELAAQGWTAATATAAAASPPQPRCLGGVGGVIPLPGRAG